MLHEEEMLLTISAAALLGKFSSKSRISPNVMKSVMEIQSQDTMIDWMQSQRQIMTCFPYTQTDPNWKTNQLGCITASLTDGSTPNKGKQDEGFKTSQFSVLPDNFIIKFKQNATHLKN